jgi:hypothetical protein
MLLWHTVAKVWINTVQNNLKNGKCLWVYLQKNWETYNLHNKSKSEMNPVNHNNDTMHSMLL